MQIVILIVAMIVVGLLMGWVAGFIWKNKRPIGVRGDYTAAVITAIVVGLMDWYVIPAMGFSIPLRNLGVALEPAISALIVLWIIRAAKR
jgi:uncharacterized membrane protein YeaQ/YmgE (transglycosylase-associated protein family)